MIESQEGCTKRYDEDYEVESVFEDEMLLDESADKHEEAKLEKIQNDCQDETIVSNALHEATDIDKKDFTVQSIEGESIAFLFNL